MALISLKLKALLKKNLIEMKRNIISTIIEIMFPIVVILLFYSVRTIFDITNNEFNIQEGSIQNYTKMRSVFNSDKYPTLNTTSNQIPKQNIDNIPNIPMITPEIYGMSIHSALKICSIYNDKHQIRKMIATIGVPYEIKEALISESIYFSNITGFILNYKSFMDFENEEEMKRYIKSKNYGENEENPLICFGISFSQDKNNHNYNYSLHYFEDSDYDGAEDVPKYSKFARSCYIKDFFQSNPDLDSYMKYQYNGYSYIMKIIYDYIYSQEIDSETKINFGILPMKYENYKSDSNLGILIDISPFFIVISNMGNLLMYVYRMVLEKETRIKEGMKIMGLTDGIHFLSYFIQYIVISFVVSAINSEIFLLVYTKTPYLILFFIFFLFSINIFALAFFFQSFTEKAKESLIISLILYYIMFFFYILVFHENSSYNLKVGLSVFPPSSIYLGFILLGKFEMNLKQFYFKDIFYIYTNYSIFVMFIMLIFDALLYLFLGYYLQNILPHDFGIRRPWNFLFTSNYWGCKKNNKNIINEEKSPLQDKKEILNDKNEDINQNFQSEDIYKEINDPKDSLKIREIVKKFDDGKVAVNRVSFNLYKNEIFSLLGHNGAGKTTLISMLIGLYEATEGEAIYDNMNILLPENITNFRRKIGICPQHDALFNNLNIREHLEMYSVFKGVSSENVESEVNKIINDFQLEEVQYILAKNLSTGNRRKLSIAISLVGGSEVIFLDEPSSSMDITSRRNLWEILKRQSENKIIILTTHYMEEASVLGKRIGIINLGKMKCIGTPLFLIEKF